MIFLLSQVTAPASGPAAGATSAGAFGPLVVAITCAMTAISLILVQVLRGWKKWRPVGEFFPNAAVRVAALCAAAAMVLAFYFLRNPNTIATLTGILVIGALGTLVSLIAYNILYAMWVFRQMKGLDANGNLVTEDILGGFLRAASKKKLLDDSNLTEQVLVDGSNGNLDLVWKRGSRGVVASLFLLAFTSLVTFASLAGTAIGLFTLLLTPIAPFISH